MSERETACWIVGGMVVFVGMLMVGLGYVEVTKTAMMTEAWVEIAREMSKGLSDLGR